MPSRWKLLTALVLLTVLAGAGMVVEAASDPEIEAVQQALVERGYNPGKIDGAMGRRTRGALRAFQRSVGLPDTGEIDHATVTALGLVSSTGEQTPAQADTPPAQADTPPAQADTPPAQADTPPAQADTPPAQADTPPALADTPPAQADTPPAQADTPPALADTPPAQADTPPAQADTPPALADTPPAQADTPPAQADTPPALADTLPAQALGVERAPIPADASTSETPGAETAPEPDADKPAPEAPRAEPGPAPSPTVETPGTGAAETEPAPKPAPKPAAKPILRFETLGWHRPQTGAGALERFSAIGAPRDFKRGTGSLFVPKAELVFLLQAGERVPGLDCDPGAGRISVEFVFGPDGPVIFTPTAGGEFCQMGIGIALEVGRNLEMRRVDWGDVQYPQGTVWITNEGLQYAR